MKSAANILGTLTTFGVAILISVMMSAVIGHFSTSGWGLASLLAIPFVLLKAGFALLRRFTQS